MSRIAFLFPGQGAQQVGMGRSVTQASSQAAGYMAQASDILGYDLADLCFNGPAEKLNSTQYSQPALFVCSIAALAYLREQQPDIDQQVAVSAGLSLGEYSALCFAGALGFSDGLKLVQCRGNAMQQAADATPSGMVSILGLSEQQVTQLCRESRQSDEVLQIANYLCPGNYVVSGHQRSIEALLKTASGAGAKMVKLAVAGAFHTSIMQPAVDELASALASVPLLPPQIPVVSNVDAMTYEDPEKIRAMLLEQVVQPVRWESSIRRMLSDLEIMQFYEIGPGRVLRGLLRRIDRSAACENVG